MSNHGLSNNQKIFVRKQLRIRDGDCCCICKKKMQFDTPLIGKNVHPDYATIEHIKDFSISKSNKLKNLKLAHYYCNIEKSGDHGNKSIKEMQGLMFTARPFTQYMIALKFLVLEELNNDA